MLIAILVVRSRAVLGLSFAICCSLQGRKMALASPATGRCASFRRPHLSRHPACLPLVFGDTTIEPARSASNVGVLFDQHLSMDQHPRPRGRHSFFSSVPPRPTNLLTKQLTTPWCARLSSRISTTATSCLSGSL